MRVPSTVSRHFLWKDNKNGSAKVQVMFSNFQGCQEKNRTQKIIDLTCRLSAHKLHQKKTSHLKLYRPN